MAREPWMDDGLCNGLDPDLFFPQRGEDYRPAVRICRTCPVQAECAMREPHGVWGGLTERQRRRIRRKRGLGIPVTVKTVKVVVT